MIYGNHKHKINTGAASYGTGYKMILLKGTYTPDRSHATLADLSAHECDSAGYPGAVDITTAAMYDADTGVPSVDCGDPRIVAGAGGISGVRYAAIYDDSLTDDDPVFLHDYGQEYAVPEGGEFGIDTPDGLWTEGE